MLIRKFNREEFGRAYGILCQGVYPWRGEADTPFGTAWCIVEPGGTAKAHKHQEHETFLIVKGRGRMTVDGETAEVGPGDVVLMKPFHSHELKNASTEEDLLFLDIYWEEMATAARLNEEALSRTAARPASVLVTATPPTPNGDLHVGHLSGPYLGADIYTRYLRMRGIETRYLTGVDDHQSYTDFRARQLSSTPRQVADRFGDAIETTLERADIAVDQCARPHASPHHARLVQEVFLRLYERGAIVARQADTLYCETCQTFLFEAYVSGTCPTCGDGTYGNACEVCGWPNDCVDLIDPKCRLCGEVPTVRPLERLYFPLAPYAKQLSEHWARAHMNPHLRSLCEQMLERGLPDIAVSQVNHWGIPVPVPGFEEQRIYVWFEMGPGYLAATQEVLEREQAGVGWRPAWTSDERQVVHFFGFDNGYFHAVLFPATFLAFDPEIRLPHAYVTNEFYRYEGAKFSTSRNHAMWGQELLDRVPADVARFYLAYDGPEAEQTNFVFSELEATVRRELVAGWEPWLRSLGAKLAADFGGKVPGTGAWTDHHQRFYQTLAGLTAEAAAAYEAETFSPQRASRVLGELVRSARRFAKAQEPYRQLGHRYEEWRTAVALEVLAAKTLALVAAPILPGFAAGLWRDLGCPADGLLHGSWEDAPAFVAGGTQVGDLDRAYFAVAT